MIDSDKELKMAIMKFWHVTVFEYVQPTEEGGKRKIVERFAKRCMTVGEANTLFAEKKEEFKGPQFSVLKEHF